MNKLNLIYPKGCTRFMKNFSVQYPIAGFTSIRHSTRHSTRRRRWREECPPARANPTCRKMVDAVSLKKFLSDKKTRPS